MWLITRATTVHNGMCFSWASDFILSPSCETVRATTEKRPGKSREGLPQWVPLGHFTPLPSGPVLSSPTQLPLQASLATNVTAQQKCNEPHVS